MLYLQARLELEMGRSYQDWTLLSSGHLKTQVALNFPRRKCLLRWFSRRRKAVECVMNVGPIYW